MGYIVLHKVDVEQKQARYYALTWAPALTGAGWALERAWGSLTSSRRQHKTVLAETRDEMLQLAVAHLRRRLRHGYAIVKTDREGQDLLDLVAAKHHGEGNEAPTDRH